MSILKLTVFLSFSFTATTALAATVAAKRKGVKVYSEASKKSDVVKKLKKGETVETIERKGMYWSIKLEDGQSAFVSVLKVKRKKAKDDALASVIRDAVQAGRQEDEAGGARSRSAVMGVRGLDESDSDFAGNAKPNLRAVYAMEDNFIKGSSLDKLGDLIALEIEKDME